MSFTKREIQAWLMANWRSEWWGMMDCDRCYARGKSTAVNGGPCDPCGMWPGLIRKYGHVAERALAFKIPVSKSDEEVIRRVLDAVASPPARLIDAELLRDRIERLRHPGMPAHNCTLDKVLLIIKQLEGK